MHPKNLHIKDFNYDLPKEKIALHPANPRDKAKLLIYQQDEILEDSYMNLIRYLPEKSVQVFNDTKVVNARMHFTKPTASVFDVFCFEQSDSMTLRVIFF